MNYLFRNQWRDVPRFAPYPVCLLVAVHYAIPLAPVPSRDQRHIKRDWRKVQKFLWAEGLGPTIRKIQSKRQQEQLLGDFHVVVVVGTPIGNEDRGPVLCLGTRHPQCAEVMLFHRDLTVRLPFAPEPERCEEAVAELECSLAIEHEGWGSLGGYNFYSDLEPPEICVRAVREVAALIARGQTPGHVPADRNSESNKYAAITTIPTPRESRASNPGRSGGVIAVGAGDYMRAQVIPTLQRTGVRLHTVVDLEPHVAQFALNKFGFAKAMTDWREAIAQHEPDAVIVATFHDSHSQIAAAAIRQGKKVLVEKPPAVCRADLELLLDACKTPGSFLEVGFNRRCAAFSRKAKELLSHVPGPTTILCVVKEVDIPPLHWYRWPKEGTRIVGNLCHWIDLAVHLIDPVAQPVNMVLTPSANAHPDEERGLNILFGDGSSATIIATSRGDSTLGVQELIEIRRADLTIRIDDFREMIATRNGHSVYHRRGFRDKGHATMYRECIARMKSNQAPLYPIRDLQITTTITILAREMAEGNLRFATIN
jgi:predicted dehydrogenase